MLKRDSLTAQMQQLSELLAKVKRLILEEKEIEGKGLILSIFSDSYNLSQDDLLNSNSTDFIDLLAAKSFHADELNLLCYFIDEYAGMQEEHSVRLLLYHKVIKLYDYLEQDYQFISFEHLARRKILEERIQ